MHNEPNDGPAEIPTASIADHTVESDAIQSRRPSRVYDSAQSQEYFARKPNESESLYDSDGDKYTKELVETEKPKSSAASTPTENNIRRRESTVRFVDLPNTKTNTNDGNDYESNGRQSSNSYPQYKHDSPTLSNEYKKVGYEDELQPYQTEYRSEQYQPPGEYSQPAEYSNQYGQQQQQQPQYDTSQYDQQYSGGQEFSQQQYTNDQQYNPGLQYDSNQLYSQDDQYNAPQQQYDTSSDQQYAQYDPSQYNSTQQYYTDVPQQQYSSTTEPNASPSSDQQYKAQGGNGTDYGIGDGNGNKNKNGNDKPKLLQKQLSKKKL